MHTTFRSGCKQTQPEERMVIKLDLEPYFVKADLIPAIVVEDSNDTVLMLAYMNRESLRLTMETGYTWFWSRSRGELWNKGGNQWASAKGCLNHSRLRQRYLACAGTPDGQCLPYRQLQLLFP